MFKHPGFWQRVIFGWIAIVLLSMMAGIAAGEKWQVISELPIHRKSLSTAVVDGKVYVIGGTPVENENGPFGMSLVEMYDPQTNTWERRADMPTPRAAPELAVVDGKIYVFSGYAGIDNRNVNFKILDVLEVYDPETDTWEKRQNLPCRCYQFGLSVVAGKIYAVGGTLDEWKPNVPFRIDLVQVYDPLTDTWAKRAKMPTRRDEVKAVVVNEKIYAIGGAGWPQILHGGPNLSTIEEYDPKINRWQKKKDMPNLRSAFATIVIENNVYLIGGFVRIAGIVEFLDTVEIYNPETEEWREGTPLPTARMPGGTVLVDGNIYMFGWIEKQGDKWIRSPMVEVFGTGFHAVTARGKLPVQWGALKAERQN